MHSVRMLTLHPGNGKEAAVEAVAEGMSGPEVEGSQPDRDKKNRFFGASVTESCLPISII